MRQYLKMKIIFEIENDFHFVNLKGNQIVYRVR